MSHFRGKSALLKTGICCLHLLEVVSQSTVCTMEHNHSGLSPAYVGLGMFQFNVIHTL